MRDPQRETMKLLLLGANGQVGWELRRSLCILGEVDACTRTEINLEDLDHLPSMLETYPADVIVNAAAYTAVDKAESEPELAFRVNAQAVAIIAQHAKKTGALLIHYSTDYVFDGTKTSPYTEDDIPNPINVYGKSKLAGEEAIRASGCRYIIFRTSWVYAQRGGNFAKTMLRLAAEKQTLKVVADQRGAPTSAELIADVTAHAINKYSKEEATETLNLSALGDASWHEYANFLIETARNLGVKLSVNEILPINTNEYPVPAPRPKNSSLSCEKLKYKLGIVTPMWKLHVDRLMQQLCVI
jgi:dTDP-4-dehydrorhamnose reductase